MKRRYDDDPADYVIMCVTAASIARILSVWKHYHEFGNILATKPRFRLQDGELKFVESPVESKADLKNLESEEGYLHRHDYHYDHWFLPHRLWRPYTLRLLRNPHNIPYVGYSIFRKIEKVFGFEFPVLNIEQHHIKSGLKRKRELVVYHENLYEEFEDLYVQLVGEYVEFVRSKGAVPIFLPLQQLRYVNYESGRKPIDAEVINRIREEYPELIVCDVRNHFSDFVSDQEELYVNRGEGGHHSPLANELIAESLAGIIRNEEEKR